MLVTRRLLSVAAALGSTTTARAFAPSSRTFVSRTPALSMAAPGVILSSTVELQTALANPATIILDARRVDEIEANGYWHVNDRQWIHAPCTPDGACPLLAVAAQALLRDPKAPVICYCASGKRASVAQAFLQERGYTTVLNAGGYPGDFGELLKVSSSS